MAVFVDDLDTRQTILSKEIVTDAAHCGAHIFQTLRRVSRTGRDSTMPRDKNTVVAAASSTVPVQICNSTTDSPIRNMNQEIINPIGALSRQWTRDAMKLKNSIDGCFAEDRGLKPIFSKVLS